MGCSELFSTLQILRKHLIQDTKFWGYVQKLSAVSWCDCDGEMYFKEI
jgi:hypothetical protein